MRRPSQQVLVSGCGSRGPRRPVFVAGVVSKRHLFRVALMRRNVLAVLGTALLSIGGIGIIVGLVWLTASRLHGTLPYLLDARAELLLYFLPAVLFTLAILGAAFVASAVSSSAKAPHAAHHHWPHAHFHA